MIAKFLDDSGSWSHNHGVIHNSLSGMKLQCHCSDEFWSVGGLWILTNGSCQLERADESGYPLTLSNGIGCGWPMTEGTSGSGFGPERLSGRVDDRVTRGEPREARKPKKDKDCPDGEPLGESDR